MTKRGHIALHSDHVDLKNVIMPLKMPLVACDTDTGTNGIT